MLRGALRRGWAPAAQRRLSSGNAGLDFCFKDRYSALASRPSRGALYSYNSALVAAASSDGMDRREEDYVVGIGVLHGLDEVEVRKNISQEWTDEKIERTIRAFSASIQDEMWKGYLIYDCVRACSADNHYSPVERAKVRRIAQIMNLSSDYVANIESFVIRQDQLNETGRRIMRGEEE